MESRVQPQPPPVQQYPAVAKQSLPEVQSQPAAPPQPVSQVSSDAAAIESIPSPTRLPRLAHQEVKASRLSTLPCVRPPLLHRIRRGARRQPHKCSHRLQARRSGCVRKVLPLDGARRGPAGLSLQVVSQRAPLCVHVESGSLCACGMERFRRCACGCTRTRRGCIFATARVVFTQRISW